MSELLPSQPPSVNRHGAVISGIILVGLGLIFLLRNMGLFYFNFFYLRNWWALFILLGTAGAWGSAWHIYQTNGQRITPAVTGPFVGGLFPLAVALIFLLNLSWATMWPIFLIIAGVAMLFQYFVASK
jgi:hypothetical protein